MSSSSRTTQYNKLHKVLKKHFKPVHHDPNRSVLEQLLLACCLENAHYDGADEAFLALVHNFFDWNEVRVSTVRELGEVMPRLPDPAAAAHRVKRVLQSIFESTYTFDLEYLRKMNLGPATEKLKAIDGTTNFTVACTIQSSLGGHAIPIDHGVVQALRIVDLVTEEDAQAIVVPGLERAIAKSKGVEFGSLLHQLGADFIANPYAPGLRAILLEINPKVRDRLPKRRAKKKASPKGEALAQDDRGKAASQAGSEATKDRTKRAGKKKAAAPETPTSKKKSPVSKKKAASKKKPTAGKSTHEPGKKSPASGMSKKKPR
jgi:endonuclease-3